MTALDYMALAVDLFTRTRRAVGEIAALAGDTNITFKIGDVVQRVEDGLPAGYPAPTDGTASRRDMIADMAHDILTGAGRDD